MPSPAETHTVFRPEDFLSLLADDLPLAQRVIQSFLKDTERRMDDIEANVRARDFDTVACHAHAVKGAAANLCADQMFADALTLEGAARNRKLVPTITALNLLTASYRQLREHVHALKLVTSEDRSEAA